MEWLILSSEITAQTRHGRLKTSSTRLRRLRYYKLGRQHCDSEVRWEANERQIMRECLVYPSHDFFAHVIGLTNRSLSRDVAMLPAEECRWELYKEWTLSKVLVA